MDWSTLLSAFVGGIAGSLVTGVVGWLSLRHDRDIRRRERQMLDADVMADADLLLMEASPPRRSSDRDTWGVQASDLSRRSYQVSRELTKLSAGHPDAAVRNSASTLASALLRAVNMSNWYVKDLVTPNRDEMPALTAATTEHEGATGALARLREAVTAAGAPKRVALLHRRAKAVRA